MHRRHAAALHYKYQAEKERPDKPNLSRSSLWDEQLIPAACSLCSVCQRTSAAALCQRQANKAALREKPPIKKCSICRLVTVRVTSVSHVQPPSSMSNNHTSALNENSEMSRFHIGLGGTHSERSDASLLPSQPVWRQDEPQGSNRRSFAMWHMEQLINMSPKDPVLSCFPLKIHV